MPLDDIETQAVKIVRGFAMDAPRKANSGHPGTAMALAPLGHVLFGRIMKHDPDDPTWPDRDRFVLSAGHASILLYSYLYLCGYGLELPDLESFRQFGSRTPGHPEHGHTPGVEVTTGPLGQGFGNSVGMAIAERALRSRFGTEVADHHVFVIAGDGCMQEGISHEAGSLAGHLRLGRLVAVYDDNHITIDGSTELSSSDDVVGRFRSYGWHVHQLGEIANDADALEAAIRDAMEVELPSLLVLRSHIGWPSPLFTDNPKAHGDPLPPEEIVRTKDILGIPSDATFWAPPDVVAEYRRRSAAKGATVHAAWNERVATWGGDRAGWDACWAQRGVAGWEAKLPTFAIGEKMATRKAIEKAINATLDVVPGVMSGAADLTGNTGTRLADEPRQSAAHPEGRQIYFGIREHGMGAALNGMALHGGVIPLGGTFFVFSDYLRPTLRLAALSGAKSVFVMTHDSVGLGEDGPTHQPVEHLAAVRAIPGLRVIRPADANETAEAWRIAVDNDGPTMLVLTRQDVPVVTDGSAVARGAGIVSDVDLPELVLVGTGSEVAVCVDAAEQLSREGVRVRVVSLPSWDVFAAQGTGYRHDVLPLGVPVLSVEAATTFGWERYADASVGIDRFGASAPGAVALDRLGINVANVVEHAHALLASRTS
ncbi:MAG: transketolase [Acidimicrobiaceae bacterium]|nr:transketolase [Acidimicrobiaceae bacterium]